MKKISNDLLSKLNQEEKTYLGSLGGQTPTLSPVSQTIESNKPSHTINRWQKCWKTSLGFVLLGVENISHLLSRIGSKIYHPIHDKRLDLYCEVYGLSYEDYVESMDRWPLKSVEMDGK